MKSKSFSLFAIPLLFFISLSVNAQFTKVGGGIVFCSGYEYHHIHTGNPGINLTAIYELNQPFHLSPGFTYMIPKKDDFFEGTRTTSLLMFDFDAHYVFNYLDRFEFYFLGGLNFTWLHSNYKGEFPDVYPDYSNNAIGLNIGAGTYMKFSEQMDFFGEIKYIVSSYDQLIVTIGVLLNVQWLTEHNE
jgi:hypothetical protein